MILTVVRNHDFRYLIMYREAEYLFFTVESFFSRRNNKIWQVLQ